MWEYIILGILQGVFEWIPISSEGIVALTSQMMSMPYSLVDVAIFLHLGTLLAVIIYFRDDWKNIIILKDKKLLRFLIIATAASLIVGFILYNIVNTIVTGISLLTIMGMGLILTSTMQRKRRKTRIRPAALAVLTGILQGLSVIPGLSRSGSTIFGLSFSKMTPEEMLRISYMMSAPVIVAASIYITIKNPIIIAGWPALITSFLVGWLTLSAVMRLAKKIDFSKFTLVFGLLCLLGAAISAVF